MDEVPLQIGLRESVRRDWRDTFLRPRLTHLQGLLEIKDTHRPRTLRQFYA